MQILHRQGGIELVLMDVQMPQLDGYATTARIRADPALRGLKVIALTAGAYGRQREAALDAGMDGFVAKPFDVDLLVAQILALRPARCPGVDGRCARQHPCRRASGRRWTRARHPGLSSICSWAWQR